MSRGQRILKTLRFGAGAQALALRLDTFAEPASASLEGMNAALEFGAPKEARLLVPLARGTVGDGRIRGCLQRILELSVPFELIGAEPHSMIEFRVVLEDASGKPIESLPADGVIAFATGAEETDWIV